MTEQYYIDPNAVKKRMTEQYDIDSNRVKNMMIQQNEIPNEKQTKFVYGYDVIHNSMNHKNSEQRIYEYDVAFSAYLAILNMYKGKGFMGDLHVNVAYSKAKQAYDDLTVEEKDSTGLMPNIEPCGDIMVTDHPQSIRERVESQYELSHEDMRLLSDQVRAMDSFYGDT